MNPGETATYVAVRMGALPPSRAEECRALLSKCGTFALCMRNLREAPGFYPELAEEVEEVLTLLDRGRRVLRLLVGNEVITRDKADTLEEKHLMRAILGKAEIYSVLSEESIVLTPEFKEQFASLEAEGETAERDHSTQNLLVRLDEGSPTSHAEIDQLLPSMEQPKISPATAKFEQTVIAPGPSSEPFLQAGKPAVAPLKPSLWRPILVIAASALLGVFSYLGIDAVQRESKFRGLLATGNAAIERGDLDAARAAFVKASHLKPGQPDAAKGIDRVDQICREKSR